MFERGLELNARYGSDNVFDLSTEDGDVRIDAEVEGLVESRERARGRLGDGSGKIRVSTDGGRIDLRQ